VPQVQAVVAGPEPLLLGPGDDHDDEDLVHGDWGAGELRQVRVVEREGEEAARRVRRYLVRRLELDLDGDLVVDGVSGCTVADVPVDAVVREGLGQRAAGRGGDRVQIADLQCLHAGGGGEGAATVCRPLGQQPAPLGLRYRHDQQPSRRSESLIVPLNCKDLYSCCLLPAYGANSPGITKRAEDGMSPAEGERGVGSG
jgi:hypothetical protein